MSPELSLHSSHWEYASVTAVDISQMTSAPFALLRCTFRGISDNLVVVFRSHLYLFEFCHTHIDPPSVPTFFSLQSLCSQK